MVTFLELADMRGHRSAKWTGYEPDVLPLPVAELDVQLAPAIAQALHEAVDRGDTGYAPMDGGHAGAFVQFAQTRWGWRLDPQAVIPTAEVGSAVRHALGLARPGPVVISPPVYPQFFDWPLMVGRELVCVPLRQIPAESDSVGPRSYRLDLDGLEAAFAQGAAAYVLCHPHNPVGRVHERAELIRLAELAQRYGVLIVSDEVHAPLVLDHSRTPFVPFLDSCPQAKQVAVAVHSPSKAWNIAGLKCAFLVAPTATGALRAQLAGLAQQLPWEVGIFGALAAQAAYEQSQWWLDELLVALTRSHRHLITSLAAALPAAQVTPADFGYLAWVDLRALGWPADPAELALRMGRLALGVGPSFGAGGAGHVRVNVGTSPAVITEAVRRLAHTDRALRA